MYAEYGEKTEKLQNKALEDLEEEVDLTGPSIIPYRLKQEKLLLFLSDTEQAISNGMYIKTYLRVIERTNYINKAVLAWRRRTLPDRTVAFFWSFITEAHKKQRLKLEQGSDEQAKSVMLQNTVKDMALKISQLERYTNRQQVVINDVIDKVQDDDSVRSRSDRFIPGVIKTNGTPSTTNSSELSTAQALIASLTASLADAERNRYIPTHRRQPGGPGQGNDRDGPAGRGRGGDQRPLRDVLGKVNNEVDQRLIRKTDPNRIEKKFNNKNYCHTHGYECATKHDSAHCMYPEKSHKPKYHEDEQLNVDVLFVKKIRLFILSSVENRCLYFEPLFSKHTRYLLNIIQHMIQSQRLKAILTILGVV